MPIAQAIQQLAQQQQAGLAAIESLLQQQLSVLRQGVQGGGGRASGGGLQGWGGFLQSLVGRFSPRTAALMGRAGGWASNFAQTVASWQRAQASSGLPGPPAPGATTGPGTPAPGFGSLFSSLLRGGAGGGAGGGALASAAGPLGIIAAVTIAGIKLEMELVKLPFRLAKWGEALLESQKKLAQFSGAVAAVFARAQVREIQRDVRSGAQLAPSMDDLNDSLQDLKDTLLPLQNTLQEVKNLIASRILQFTNEVSKVPAILADVLVRELARKAGLVSEGEAKEISITDWLNQTADDASRGVAGQDPGAFAPQW